MVEYRLARPDERDAYHTFANMVFNGIGDPIDFETGIPKVYAPDRDTANLQHIAYDPERGIVGLVAMLPGLLHTPDGDLKTGYIGTVSTHPQARGEGLMKGLMAFTLEDMRSRDTDIAILNGRRQRYGFFGYAQGGEMYRFEISIGNITYALKNVDIADTRFVKIEEGTELEQAALKLHNTRAAHYERGTLGFARCCQTFYFVPRAFYRKGELQGYLVSSRDRATLAEAVAVSDEALDAMLKAWYIQTGRSDLTVCVAPWDAQTRRHLASYAEGVAISHNVNARILKFANTVEKLLKLKAGYTRLQDGSLALDVEGEAFTVQVKDGKVSVTPGAENALSLDSRSATQLLLAPYEYEDKPETPAGWFPLPICAATPDEF